MRKLVMKKEELRLIHPDKCKDYVGKMEYTKSGIRVVETVKMPMGEVDLYYELLTLWVSKGKQLYTQKDLGSKDYYRWRELFFASPYPRIFGIEYPVIDMPNWGELKLLPNFFVLCKKHLSIEDGDMHAWSAMKKLLDIYDGKSNVKLSDKEDFALEECLLGTGKTLPWSYLSDRKEESVQDNEPEINRDLVKNRIDEIVKKYISQCNHSRSTVVSKEEMQNITLKFPEYLKPIMKGIYTGYTKIPWMYKLYDNRNQHASKVTSLFSEFTYSYRYEEEQEVCEKIAKVDHILECEEYSGLKEKEYISNYYNFIERTLKNVEHDDNKYIEYYTLEKIYAGELFFQETMILFSKLNEHKIDALDDEKKRILGKYLSIIYRLAGIWGRIKVATTVLEIFFDESVEVERLDAKLGKVIEDYENSYIILNRADTYKKMDLKMKMKNQSNKECEWYEEWHKNILSDRKIEWYENIGIPGWDKIMRFVMQKSEGIELKFRFRRDRTEESKDDWKDDDNDEWDSEMDDVILGIKE